MVANLTETVKNIEDMIKSLGSAARERLEVAALHEKQYAALRKAQTDFVAASAPAMMDAQSQINAILGSANLSTDDATEAARTVEQLGNVVASTNLMASDMTAALSANNSDIARSHREGIQGDAGARQIEPRATAQERRHQGAFATRR